jgi:hypothetical protein
MSRKRLDQVYLTARVEWQANAMQRRPQLGALVAYAIASWAYVEASLGNFLTLLLGSNAAPTIALFMNSRMASQQIEDVRSVAKAVFSEHDFILAKTVLDFAKKLAEQRNELAHSLWGYSDDIPDGIIAVNAGQYMIKNFQQASGDQVASRFDKPKMHEAWVYKEEDLIEIIKQIEALWSYVPMLASLNNADVAKREEVWKQFRKAPEIRALLPNP